MLVSFHSVCKVILVSHKIVVHFFSQVYSCGVTWSLSNITSFCFRYQYILGAATSPAVKVNEETLTYLNQGNFPTWTFVIYTKWPHYCVVSLEPGQLVSLLSLRLVPCGHLCLCDSTGPLNIFILNIVKTTRNECFCHHHVLLILEI